MNSQIRTKRLVIALVLCLAVFFTLLPVYGENIKIGLIYSKEDVTDLKKGRKFSRITGRQLRPPAVKSLSFARGKIR